MLSLADERSDMSDFLPAPPLPRDRVAECHIRAAADRVRAEGMDTGNGRRKFEESAATWDQRAALLGRLDASFNKRELLDAEARSFQAPEQLEGLAGAAGPSAWEDEGGTGGSLPPPAGPGDPETGSERR